MVTYVGHVISRDCDDKRDIMNHRTRFISQVNNIGKLDCVKKMRLLKAYCSNFYGSELWDLANDSMETLDKTWRNALRRIFNLPFTSHTNILNYIERQHTSLRIFCQRSLKFIRSCLCSRNAVVFIARHGVTYGRMRSLLGRNVQLCSEKYKCKVNDLINPNFSIRFIANVCKQYVQSEMTDR